MDETLTLLGLIQFAFLLFLLALFALGVVSACFVYAKARKPWWNAVVPFYNLWVLLEISRRPRWWILPLLLLPLVSQQLMASATLAFSPALEFAALGILAVEIVLSFLLAQGLARSFGQGSAFAVGLILLPFVFLPLLAFGPYAFQPREAYVDDIGPAIVRFRERILRLLERLRRG